MILSNCRLVQELSPFSTPTLADVHIENGIIKKICETKRISSRANKEIIDCAGKTLLPGLIDLHTHIVGLTGAGDDCKEEPMQLIVEAAREATRYLDYGFTTIRDCGSYERVANYIRKMVSQGLLEAPDILACGKIVMPCIEKKTGALAMMYNPSDGADAVMRGVREEVAYEADFIKIYASGSAFVPSGVPTRPIITKAEVIRACETASSNDRYVAAHCHADRAIRECIEAGVRTIEHATYISDDTLELLYKTEDCYLVPTFSAMYVSQTEPEAREFWINRLTPMLYSVSRGIRKAYEHGEIIGFGTDAAAGSKQYESGVEFIMRRDNCHIDNLELLKQATVNNALIAKLRDRGSVKEGLIADLILVNGNPDEDLDVMTRKPLKVWKHGALVRKQ